MTITWTRPANQDLIRLYKFLAKVDQQAAAIVVQKLTDGPDLLQLQPRIGTRLTEFGAREVRCILIGDYEMRYEIETNEDIWILRIWHTRELR